MITDTEMRGHLTRFLTGCGTTLEKLEEQVEPVFGEPLLTVASGSVLHGFGNTASDIDLHIVVDDRRVTDFPVSSHQLGVAVDTTYFDAAWVREESEVVTGDHAPDRHMDRPGWKAGRTRLLRLGRLSLGYALAGTEEWRDWQVALRPSFVEYAVSWWATEALRYRTAARLLYDRHPLAGAMRYCDMVTAALDAFATANGETYVGHKWLGIKLERLDRPELVEAYRRTLDLPVTAGEVGAYRDFAEELVSRLTADDPLPEDPFVRLTPADGTTNWQVHDRVLVHRWGLRGVELSTRDIGADPKLSWTGRVSELPDDLRVLTEEDLLWLSVSKERP